MNETINTGSFADVVEQSAPTVQSEATAVESTPTESSPPKYYWSNDLPGNGERPDYLIEKYKTVEDQAKAYKAAQPLLGRVKDLEGIIGAPETYAIPDELQSDDLVKKYTEFSKKNNFNQAFFDQGLELFKEARAKAQVSHQAEMQKLGEGASERVQVLSQWVKNHFPPDVFNALKDIPFKAEVVHFFEGVKSMTTQSTVPTGIANTQATQDSMSRIREDLAKNYKDVRSNPEVAKEFMERMNKAGAKPIEKR
jgi:hypothetical protein